MTTPAHLHSEISNRHCSTAPPVCLGHHDDSSHGPAVLVCDGARFGESMQTLRVADGVADQSSCPILPVVP